MKYHALLPVRDEADIIKQSLDCLLTWADAVYVFDSGSVDETWEIVNEFAARDRRVVPLKKEPVYFSDTLLRGWMFHHARQNMRDGDWFLRVDADEFHHILPPEFVQTRMSPHETVAYHQYYDFALLASEVTDWEVGREKLSDRVRPIDQRRRWFTPSSYSEPRLCKYRTTMQWPAHVSFPYNAGYVARERLPIRHYPHRDPQQLERRCRLRAIMMAEKANSCNWSRPDEHHWTISNWREFVVPDDLPGLRRWDPGTNLPEFYFTNHLHSPIKRATQRLVHTFGLPILDRLRDKFPDESMPLPLPREIVERLQLELSECRTNL